MITDFQYALTSIVLVPFFTAIGLVIGGNILHKCLLRVTRGTRISSKWLTGVFAIVVLTLHVVLALHSYTTIEGWDNVARVLYSVTFLSAGCVAFVIDSKS